ncbi:hypothetical protein BHU72_07195 [Desulfuribacillus stibiiarsenatis]|uniref:Uncharacterized protein n=1 Tax=Desulfuribacillus stibiiarsenatis TaxID=1390249 RepID=A0A1E5L4R7_9FIRM|nr:sulfurtransferase-like selenium metabolism protein YedF [Desulfuribacillus stibiiarsenatis]OEH84969.1 hypothetical protein BHU72_07195 [Desulfuribacillus stibiiarsenatis]
MAKKYAVLVSGKALGKGEDELGVKLMSNYLIALSEGEELPSHVFLINSGVLLAQSGEKTVVSLQALAEKGVKILACGTCLDYYQIKDQLAVGEVSNIYTLRDIIAQTDNLVSIG